MEKVGQSVLYSGYACKLEEGWSICLLLKVNLEKIGPSVLYSGFACKLGEDWPIRSLLRLDM